MLQTVLIIIVVQWSPYTSACWQQNNYTNVRHAISYVGTVWHIAWSEHNNKVFSRQFIYHRNLPKRMTLLQFSIIGTLITHEENTHVWMGIHSRLEEVLHIMSCIMLRWSWPQIRGLSSTTKLGTPHASIFTALQKMDRQSSKHSHRNINLHKSP